jgi:hypothetical protein
MIPPVDERLVVAVIGDHRDHVDVQVGAAGAAERPRGRQGTSAPRYSLIASMSQRAR